MPFAVFACISLRVFYGFFGGHSLCLQGKKSLWFLGFCSILQRIPGALFHHVAQFLSSERLSAGNAYLSLGRKVPT
jgi:hypothetical protein